MQQWGTTTMLDSVLRLLQFHVQLDEDDAGVPYSRVHCRLKYLGLQTTWTLLFHVSLGVGFPVPHLNLQHLKGALLMPCLSA